MAASKQWDVFISHASEDKVDVVEPLAGALMQAGLSVWYDRLELKLGDSLRRKIDEGLANCRYGVVILSPSFFEKHFPNLELDGLAQKEVSGEKVILPVWCNISDADVRRYSPTLADKIAARWEKGLQAVVKMIVEVVKPSGEKPTEIDTAREDRIIFREKEPLVVWRLPRGFLVLSDLVAKDVATWSTIATYYNYPDQCVLGTHYHESYDWLEQGRLNAQFAKLQIEKGDWHFAHEPLSFICEIRHRKAFLDNTGVIHDYSLEHYMEEGIVSVYADGRVPPQQPPASLRRYIKSGPLRDLLAELGDLFYVRELIANEYMFTPDDQLLRKVGRIRRQARIEAHRVFPQSNPIIRNLEEVLDQFETIKQGGKFRPWVRELQDVLNDAIIELHNNED